jgi:hypothetical protein
VCGMVVVTVAEDSLPPGAFPAVLPEQGLAAEVEVALRE